MSVSFNKLFTSDTFHDQPLNVHPLFATGFTTLADAKASYTLSPIFISNDLALVYVPFSLSFSILMIYVFFCSSSTTPESFFLNVAVSVALVDITFVASTSLLLPSTQPTKSYPSLAGTSYPLNVFKAPSFTLVTSFSLSPLAKSPVPDFNVTVIRFSFPSYTAYNLL